MTADTFVRTRAAGILLTAALAGYTAPAHAQDLRCDPGDTEVRGLVFSGNRTYTDTDLGAVIVTTPSAAARRYLDLPFTARRCLDRGEFANDRLRLILFYRRRGFPSVTVDTALTPSGLGGVVVHFDINEGAPTILRSLTVTGLDSIPRHQEYTSDLPIRAGRRYDRTLVDASIDLITRRMRSDGYPAVAARSIDAIAPGAATATDTIAVSAGAHTLFGASEIVVTPAAGKRQAIPDRTVRRIVGIDSGRPYSETRVIDAQRALYQTDAYTHVTIALDSVRGRRIGHDSIAPVLISIAENTMHAARTGVGYGTLDCFRATAQLDDYDFLSGARHLTLQTRVSKIGVGRPLDGASGLCPQARQDPYSDNLNYYVGATLRQPVFLGLRTVPTLTAYTSRVSEYKAFVRTTAIGGIASVQYTRWARTPLTFGYTLDYGRTEAQPALFCAVFNLCTPEDRARVERTQRLAVLSASVVHDASDDPLAPTRGSITRFEIRHASPLVFSDTALQFNTLLAEASKYVPIGGGNVLAMHVRGGSVFGRNFSTSTSFIPPQERLYAGGPNSVRGFAQNELGGETYIAPSYDTVTVTTASGTATYFRYVGAGRPRRVVPVGGNSMLVGNLELRLRSPVLPDVLQFGIFTDAGDVWNRGRAGLFGGYSIKVTPGVQIAALTPVGPARLVVGYNPNRQPAGPLYFESTGVTNGALPCVSPANTLPVITNANGALVQTPGSCDAYRPPSNTSFRSRLTFGLAIGQAF